MVESGAASPFRLTDVVVENGPVARGLVVSLQASQRREACSVSNDVEWRALGSAGVHVESSQGIGGDGFGRVLGSELANEVIGAEACQPTRIIGLRRPFVDEDGAAATSADAPPHGTSAVVVEDDPLCLSASPDRDRRAGAPSRDVLDVERECFTDFEAVGHEQGDKCIEARVERRSRSAVAGHGFGGQLDRRTRVAWHDLGSIDAQRRIDRTQFVLDGVVEERRQR